MSTHADSKPWTVPALAEAKRNGQKLVMLTAYDAAFAGTKDNKAFNAVTEGFLGQCLGGRSQPIGSDFTGSSIQVPAGADGVPGLAEALKSHTAEVKK